MFNQVFLRGAGITPCGGFSAGREQRTRSPRFYKAAHAKGWLARSRAGETGPPTSTLDALAALAGDAELRRIGERLITHRFAAADLPRAFAVAQSRACIKAVVTHAGATP